MNNTDKKLGRRKAGSWGRTTKAGKRIANKATRKAGIPSDLNSRYFIRED